MLIKDLDDDFVTDPVATYPPGTLVRARVLTLASHNNNNDDNDNDDDDDESSRNKSSGASVRTSMPTLSMKVIF